MALNVRVEQSSPILLLPGEPRGFAFNLPPETLAISMAFPSTPQAGKQSLWTVANGIETDGVIGGGPGAQHRLITHWVTVQVADPAVPTWFTIKTMIFFL